MEINIDNEKLGNAYKCLEDAYDLVKTGLGNFDNLNKDALGLINKSNIENIKMLDKFYEDCQLLESRMQKTIELLKQVNDESANYFQNLFDIIDDEFVSLSVDGVKDYGSEEHLKYVRQFAKNSREQNVGPSGLETWCPLSVVQLVENMETIYGHTNLKDSIREDGVRVLSGVDPNGQYYEDLVIVAADVRHERNPDGTFERGQIVETSLGTGIVVDLCEEAMNIRENGGPVLFDIYAAWWEPSHSSIVYGKD